MTRYIFYNAGEMIVGPAKAVFMDEISNGLDSSTTFQIVSCLQHFVHITDATALISLLQPAPEAFDLFDDVLLMAEGKIVYHGPRTSTLQFFEECGFKCPERKGVADFLQEVGYYHTHFLSGKYPNTSSVESMYVVLFCFRSSLEKIKHSFGMTLQNHIAMFLLSSSFRNSRIAILAGS